MRCAFRCSFILLSCCLSTLAYASNREEDASFSSKTNDTYSSSLHPLQQGTEENFIDDGEIRALKAQQAVLSNSKDPLREYFSEYFSRCIKNQQQKKGSKNSTTLTLESVEACAKEVAAHLQNAKMSNTPLQPFKLPEINSIDVKQPPQESRDAQARNLKEKINQQISECLLEPERQDLTNRLKYLKEKAKVTRVDVSDCSTISECLNKAYTEAKKE